MPTLLQINVTANWGSTGRIAEDCNAMARSCGWDTYIIYGRYANPSESKKYCFTNKEDVYEHYIENRILDNEGLASRRSTKRIIQEIERIKPDVIHLHNIHDHYLNYPILFSYLNQTNIKVVYTFHDFWAITGGCAHFVGSNCLRWQNGCYDCPQKHNLIDRSKRNYQLKKKYIGGCENMVVTAVSEWVGNIVHESFLKDRDIRVINNGVDTEMFAPTPLNSNQTNLKNVLDGKFVIMGVSSQWKSKGKGLDDYKKLSLMLKDDEVIVLVGVSDEIIRKLPNNILGVRRTNNQMELAALYTRAEVLVSFSSAETFGLTIVEGYACGTPAVVYDNTAQPFLITPQTGFVARNKDVEDAYSKIQKIRKNSKPYYSDACVTLAREKYDKCSCYNKYMDLYNELLAK